MVYVETTIPVRTISAANAREHHHAKARRVAQERGLALVWMRTHHAAKPAKDQPLTITLTRLSGYGHKLDAHDNLAMACKGSVDGVAEWLGVDDGSELLEWRYQQRRTGHKDHGHLAVRIEDRVARPIDDEHGESRGWSGR